MKKAITPNALNDFRVRKDELDGVPGKSPKHAEGQRRPKKRSPGRPRKIMLQDIGDAFHEVREDICDVEEIASAMLSVPATRAIGLALQRITLAAEDRATAALKELDAYRKQERK